MVVFRSATENIYAAADEWTNLGKTFKAALVQSIGATPISGWRTLSDFIASNPLIPDQAQPDITGRIVESFNTTEDASIFKFTDELSFGNPSAGPNVPGVLIYEDVAGDPAQSPIWSYDDNTQNFPLLLRGGETKYGSAGPVNEIIRWLPSQAGTATLAGCLKDMITLVDPWDSDSPYTFKLRLCLSTGTLIPDVDWDTLDDLTAAGVAYAAVPAGDATILASDRLDSAWNIIGSGNQFQHVIQPAAQLQWSAVPAGQSIGAVVLYRDTGNDATSTVWHWDSNFTPFLSNGGNITYGSGLQQVMNYGQH